MDDLQKLIDELYVLGPQPQDKKDQLKELYHVLALLLQDGKLVSHSPGVPHQGFLFKKRGRKK